MHHHAWLGASFHMTKALWGPVSSEGGWVDQLVGEDARGQCDGSWVPVLLHDFGHGMGPMGLKFPLKRRKDPWYTPAMKTKLNMNLRLQHNVCHADDAQ